MTECILNYLDDILIMFKNFVTMNVSACCVLVILCAYCLICTVFVWKERKNKIINTAFFVITVWVIVLVLRRDDVESTSYIDKVETIATLALTFIALRMSFSQGRKANFEFSQKIAFPNIEEKYELKELKDVGSRQYRLYKQEFNLKKKASTDTSIFCFSFNLKEALNPQINYRLNDVTIYDSKITTSEIGNLEHIPHDSYKTVLFENNLLNTNKINIVIDDTENHFLQVLKNPSFFSTRNVEVISLVMNFYITDLVSEAFQNKQLYLIISFSKIINEAGESEYIISSVQTMASK